MAPVMQARWKFQLAQEFFAEGLIVVALSSWWLGSLLLPAYLLPTPFSVFRAMGSLLFDPAFAANTGATASRILTSMILAVLIGSILALIPFYLPSFGVFIHERVKPLLNSFPSIGWALLGSIWFGVSSSAVIFVQTAILIPFILINISEGLKELSVEDREMAHSFSRSQWRGFWLLIFPMILPYLIAAIRISYGVAWKVSLVAELFGARSGLGFLIMEAQTNARIDVLFAACLMIVAFYIVGDKFILAPLSRMCRAK